MLIKEEVFYFDCKTILKKWFYYQTYFSSVPHFHLPSVRAFYKALLRLSKEDYAIIHEKYITLSEFKTAIDPITGNNKFTDKVITASNKAIAAEKGITTYEYMLGLNASIYRLEKIYRELMGKEVFKKYEEYFVGDLVLYVHRDSRNKTEYIYYHRSPVLFEEDISEKAIEVTEIELIS